MANIAMISTAPLISGKDSLLLETQCIFKHTRSDRYIVLGIVKHSNATEKFKKYYYLVIIT